MEKLTVTFGKDGRPKVMVNGKVVAGVVRVDIAGDKRGSEVTVTLATRLVNLVQEN